MLDEGNGWLDDDGGEVHHPALVVIPPSSARARVIDDATIAAVTPEGYLVLRRRGMSGVSAYEIRWRPLMDEQVLYNERLYRVVAAPEWDVVILRLDVGHGADRYVVADAFDPHITDPRRAKERAASQEQEASLIAERSGVPKDGDVEHVDEVIDHHTPEFEAHRDENDLEVTEFYREPGISDDVAVSCEQTPFVLVDSSDMDGTENAFDVLPAIVEYTEGKELPKEEYPSHDPSPLRSDEQTDSVAVEQWDSETPDNACSGNFITGKQAPHWAKCLGIEEIDGRPLYAYHLDEDDEAYDYLLSLVMADVPRLVDQPDRHVCARFVLWSAEWFKRHYAGGGRTWTNLVNPLGISLSQGEASAITERGLEFWGVPVMITGGARRWLATLSCQGGFPIAALEAESGWAHRFLGSLVSSLLRQPGSDRETAYQIAGDLLDTVPLTWQNPQIRVVSADLAMSIVDLRRRAAQHGITDGSLVQAWLDNTDANWRQRLALGSGNKSASKLLEHLISTDIVANTESIRCRRILIVSNGQRSERIDLQLTGALRSGKRSLVPKEAASTYNRLRLRATGEFARYVSGDMATCEPDADGAWTSIAMLRRTSHALPHEVGVTLELQSGERRVGEAFEMPGGKAIRSPLRVYDDASGTEEWTTSSRDNAALHLVGTGSAGYASAVIYLDVPNGWECVPQTDSDRIEKTAWGTADRSMHRACGSILITTPEGDRYLVRSGQTGAESDTLVFDGNAGPPGIASADGCAIHSGMPNIMIETAGRLRSAAPGELAWRHRGERGWRKDVPNAMGHCDIAWMDSATGHVRDRRDLTILPPEFSVTMRHDGKEGRVTIVGWKGDADMAAPAVRTQDGWRLPYRTVANATGRMILKQGDAKADLVVNIPHQAWITRWNGAMVDQNSILSLATISEYVARTTGRCELLADVCDKHRRMIRHARTSWVVDGELPLSSIRDDIAALLRPHANIDHQVKLNFNDGHETYWYVAEFDQQLVRSGGGLVAETAVADPAVKVTARRLDEPQIERQFETYSLHDQLNHRPIGFEHPGRWLVYLRSERRVLTRPVPWAIGIPRDMSSGPFARPAMHDLRDDRMSSFRRVLEEVSCNPGEAFGVSAVKSLVELVASLSGLPPATFDVLSILSEYPTTAAAMAFEASAEQVPDIMAVMDGLMYDWSLVPAQSWETAQKARFERLFASLDHDESMILDILSAITRRRRLLCDHAPALRHVLLNDWKTQGYATIANDFIIRSNDRFTERHNPFRPKRDAILPPWPYHEDNWRYLDAPIIAAKAAMGQVRLEQVEILCIKDVARRHPRWFRDGYNETMVQG